MLAETIEGELEPSRYDSGAIDEEALATVDIPANETYRTSIALIAR
jgi:hypothetical protein